MIDRVKAFREPATVIAIVVVLVGIATTSGRIATDLHTYPIAQVLRGVSGLYGLVDALVLTVLALACVLVAPKTRHAEQLTLAASLLLWLGAVVGLVFLVVSLLAAGETSLSRILESVGGLTDIALRALMGYVLLLGRRVAAASEPAVAPPSEPEEQAEPTPQEEPSSTPTWRPDEATGVVWRSAADAASGAAAGTYPSGGRRWDVSSEAAELPPVRGTEPEEATSPRIIRGEEGTGSPRSGPPSWDTAETTRQDWKTRNGEENPSL